MPYAFRGRRRKYWNSQWAVMTFRLQLWNQLRWASVHMEAMSHWRPTLGPLGPSVDFDQTNTTSAGPPACGP